MKIFFKVIFCIFCTFWILLGLILHGLIFSFFNDKDNAMAFFCLFFTVLWWGLTGLITVALVKWRKYRKKEIEEKRKAAEYKQKYLSEVEIENPYFGKGILVKDSSPPKNCYTDIKSGFDRMFDSFGKKSDDPCDLYEFIVQENNIEHVLASLEKIYKRSEQIMEECYDKIYKEIVEFFENVCDPDEGLKKEFDPDYLKENWYVFGLDIDDDGIGFSIGIKAAENPEADSYYDIIISVDYNTLEPEVSFNVVW